MKLNHFHHVLASICGLALAFSLTAAAQDLKPAKDKSTKKYGYQVGKGNWVIAPTFDDAKKFKDGLAEVEIAGRRGIINTEGALVLPAIYDDISKFDKNGYCELMQKVNGTKLRGVADRNGRVIIPVQARSVDVDRSGLYIYAKYDTEIPGFNSYDLWGVYDNQGNEIFAPQFSYTPSFDGSIGIARSGKTGLYGIIGADGSVIKPFSFFAISRFSGGYKALGTDLVHHIWSPDLRDAQSMPQPGAVVPYDPKDDPIRVAAWHKGPVGIRLHSNSLKRFEMHNGFLGAQAACTMLPINWGFGRFVRLEPCVVSAGTPDAMYYGSGNRWYTLKAILYEPDGTFVKEVCSRGWIEADCSEGAIYNADGKERWIVLANPNAPALPAMTVNVQDYRPLGHSDVYEGLGITIAEVSKLRSIYEFTSRCKFIYDMENVGVLSYLPRIPSEHQVKAEFIASKAPVFHYPFHMGEVVNCKVSHKDGHPEFTLTDDLVCVYKDKIEDPYYTMTEGPEVIFWGPNNARTVRLSLEAKPRTSPFTADDVHGTEFSYSLVLNMFEEDGRWLRTLAAAPWADFVKDGIIVFEPLGIALISPFSDKPKHKGHGPGQPGGNRSGTPARNTPAAPEPAPGLQPLPHTLSALEAALKY